MELVTKAGRLTRYALACGYVEFAESNNDDEYKSVRLEMSGSTLIVSTYDRMNQGRAQFGGNNMNDARKMFSVKCREFEVKRIPNSR